MGLEELLALNERLKNNGETLSSIKIAKEEMEQAALSIPTEETIKQEAINNGLALISDPSIEVTVKKKNIILDNSMFSAYETCARLFNFKFNMQLIEIDGKSNSLEAGSIVHAILEVFYTNLINGFNRNLAIQSGMTAGEEYYFGCLDCKKQSCQKHKLSDPYIGCKNVPLESDKYVVGYNWIVKTMEQYFQHYMSDPYRPISSERVKGKVIYEDDEIRILWKAKIDVMIDTGQLPRPISMDHKSRKIDRKMGSINSQFMGQCVVTESNNMIVNKIGFQASLKPEQKFIREMMSYSYDRLSEWKDIVIPTTVYRFLQSIELDRWDPSYSSCETKYGFCDFHHVCSLDRGLREGKLKEEFMVGPKWDPSNE